MSKRSAALPTGSGVSRPVQARLRVVDSECPVKRLRIVTNATIAFLTSGFEGANLEDIAIASGVGKMTIYRYFTDKADLFEQCVLEAVAAWAIPLESLLQSDLPMRDLLVRFAEEHTLRMLKPIVGSRPFYELARTLIGTSLKHPELARSCSAIFRRKFGEKLTSYFQERISDGEIVHDDPAFLAEHFAQTIFFTNLIILDPSRAPSTSDVGRQAQRTVDLFLRGCVAGG